MYLFTWPTTQLGGQLGSCHGLEIPYVFNTLDRGSTPFFVGDNPPTELAGAMNASWAAFARNGDPGDGALGAWPPYEPGPRSTMILDVEPQQFPVDLVVVLTEPRIEVADVPWC